MQGNPIWDALQNPSRKYERELKHLKLSSEEVLLECFTILDTVKESPKRATFLMQGIWDSVYCDLRDLDLGDAEDEELELGASIIVYSVMLLLSFCNGSHYTKLTTLLIDQLYQHGDNIFDQLQADFMPNVWRLGEEHLKAYVIEYMDSEDLWLSDELMDKLKDIPRMAVVSADNRKPTNDEKKVDTLSNKQLIILFEQMLNIPLTPEYTNQNALAKLISRVSGNSPGSIRQRIRDGIDYEDENTRKDMDVLIALMEPVSQKIAERMKNNIE